MATEAQKARRRRNRANRRARGGRTSGNSTPGYSKLTRGAVNSRALGILGRSVWTTENYEFLVQDFVGASGTVKHINFKDSPGLAGRFIGAGEYRFLSVQIKYNPVLAVTNDRVAINAYFESTNRYSTLSDFVANLTNVRRADQPFSFNLNTASDVQILTDPANPATSLNGGIGVYWSSTQPGAPTAVAPAVPTWSGYFLLSVVVTYSFRGKKATPGILQLT